MKRNKSDGTSLSSNHFISASPVLISFCLSLYGCGLWKMSSPLVRSLEVAFNNILRRVWSLPRRCHTGILHQVAGLHSLYNTILDRASKVLHSAVNSPSTLTTDVFS